MVFDPRMPDVNMELFERQEWAATKFSEDMIEELPLDMSEAKGMGCLMMAYVDAGHASGRISCRSRTDVLVYPNSALLHRISKNQNNVETRNLGFEIMAMKHCAEHIRGFRSKI